MEAKESAEQSRGSKDGCGRLGPRVTAVVIYSLESAEPWRGRRLRAVGVSVVTAAELARSVGVVS